MITVRGRELVIPVAERQIGTQFDNNSETRQFKINRLTVGGIDISNLDFRIDLRYGKETKDTDVLEKEITDYLVDLSSHELPENDSKILSATFHVINDLERIGDHAENIVELATEKINTKAKIESDAKNELITMYKKSLEAVKIALDSYEKKDKNIAKEIKPIEEKIDNYERDFRENNILRLNEKICNANSSTIFLDLISNLERIGDHATNIAETVA